MLTGHVADFRRTGICNGTQSTNPNNKSQLSRAINLKPKKHLKEMLVQRKQSYPIYLSFFLNERLLPKVVSYYFSLPGVSFL